MEPCKDMTTIDQAEHYAWESLAALEDASLAFRLAGDKANAEAANAAHDLMGKAIAAIQAIKATI
jgi:hypothetical protein